MGRKEKVWEGNLVICDQNEPLPLDEHELCYTKYHLGKEDYKKMKSDHKELVKKYKKYLSELKQLKHADVIKGNVTIKNLYFKDNKEILDILKKIKIKKIEGTLKIAGFTVPNSPLFVDGCNTEILDELQYVKNLVIEGKITSDYYNYVPHVVLPNLESVKKFTAYHAIVDAPVLTNVGSVVVKDVDIKFSSKELKTKAKEYEANERKEKKNKYPDVQKNLNIKKVNEKLEIAKREQEQQSRRESLDQYLREL